MPETPERVYHWIPGEMVIILRMPAFLSDEYTGKLAEQVRSQLNVLLVEHQITLEHFLRRTSRATTRPLATTREGFLFALQRRQPLMALFYRAVHQDPEVEDAVPLALLYIQSHVEALAQAGLQIVGAMPNWLVTAAAPFYYADGGPAFPAQPVSIPEISSSSSSLLGWHFQVQDTLPLDSKGAEDVQIVLLDTALPVEEVRHAAAQPYLRQHWLLQRLAQDLRNNDGSFVIDYARYPLSTEVRTGRDMEQEPAPYMMADHGLALAGIVRDLAPRARIRLIRVLNDYGGGDCYSLFAALTDLEREYITGGFKKLVINLSLTLVPDIRRLPMIWFDQRQIPSTQLHSTMRLLRSLEDGLKLLFDALSSHGILVVSAAGNDSMNATGRGYAPRPPRAPARYESTLAVSSVNSRGEPSSFSNAANHPPVETGVATFGGDVRNAGEKIQFEAIKGIYLSERFPTGEVNHIGWANWIGTSFSTAIISALGAQLLGQGWTLSHIQSRMSLGRGFERPGKMLYGSTPEARSQLAAIVRVQQKFGV